MIDTIAADRGNHGEALSLNDEIREQVRGSDLYSPTVKNVMEKFWRRLDARRALEPKL